MASKLCTICEKPVAMGEGVSEYDGSRLQHATCFFEKKEKKNTSPSTPVAPVEELRKLADLFWQFHNDRLTNPNLTEMKPYLKPIEKYVQRKERLARIDEIQRLSDDTADLLPNETWKSWAFRVSDYLQDRIKELQTTSEGK